MSGQVTRARCEYFQKEIAPRMQAFLNIETKMASRRLLILKTVRNAGPIGLTLNEIGNRLGQSINKFSGRVSELKKAGLLEPLKLNGKTIKRRRQTVWNACDQSNLGVLSHRRRPSRSTTGTLGEIIWFMADNKAILTISVEGASLRALTNSKSLKKGARIRLDW